MECYFDEIKGMWRVDIKYEATTWGETEEDARIEMNRIVSRFTEEVKQENREKLMKI